MLNKHALSLNCIPLQASHSINNAISGNFSGPKQQEFVVSKGNALELLRVDDQGKVVVVCSTPGFCIIRSLITFRLAGANRDYVVIGSDSGTISIVEYDNTGNCWKIVHCEVFGRTGCRRAVPGEYVAADPKGRAIMISAIEKQKFVYIMNRDSSNKLTISSPLEAHKSETINFSITGLDVEFDNPIFALIELEYSEADQDPTGQVLNEIEKNLVYYEVDLGLNNVVRKWSEPISRTANILLPVPGGANFPSGVLVCGENWVSYKHQGHREIRTPLPRRHNMPNDRGVLIVTGTLHKLKDSFFYIIQSEFGDLYKVTMQLDPSNPKAVVDVVVQVFDSLPLSNGLCITKQGMLFSASEFGNHLLCQFQGLDDPNAVTASSVHDEELGDDAVSASSVAPIFRASSKLRNLLIIDEISSLAAITDLGVVEDFHHRNSKQFYALCGRGNRSSLRILRHGVTVSAFAESRLPGKATNIWTVKKNRDDPYDSYIVVSFMATSLVLSIGENVEEVTDSGFLTSVATIQVGLLASNTMVQVHNKGIRRIKQGQQPSEWRPTNKRSIQFAAMNSHQVVVALTGGEIIYFELDETGELQEVMTKDFDRDVTCVDLGEVPEGRVKSPFMAVGLSDDTVRLLSTDLRTILDQVSNIPTDGQTPASVALVEMTKEVSYEEQANGSVQRDESVRSLYLNIGTKSGVLIRVVIDQTSGQYSDARRKFLGAGDAKLKRIQIQSHPAMMAMSSRAWLTYNYLNRYHQTPLSYDKLEAISDISIEANPHGLVAVVGNDLRFISIENLGELFNQTVIPLKYTPKRFSLLKNGQMVIIETDINEYAEQERAAVEAHYDQIAAAKGLASPESAMEVDGNNNEEEDDTGMRVPLRNAIPHGDGKWASLLRVLDAKSGETTLTVELPPDEAAFSVCTCTFQDYENEEMIAVGTVEGLVLSQSSSGPRFKHCYINIYRNIGSGSEFQLLHKTEVEDIPYAMINFHNKLLVGIGKSLRLYAFGKKKLLKKLENKSLPNTIVKLQVSGDRIFVGDVSQSVSIVKYRESSLTIFADDTLPRFITCMATLDHHTIACGDKFGNVFVLRLPDHVNDDMLTSNSNANSNANLWDHGWLNGAPNKVEVINQYYLGEIPTAMIATKRKDDSNSNVNKSEVIIVSTITGGIYAFSPNKSSTEATFFQQLEMFMRQEYTNLCHRDHLAFCSLYGPVKNVIDISLCERFMSMSYAKQKEFAESVDRELSSVVKKMEEIRNFETLFN